MRKTQSGAIHLLGLIIGGAILLLAVSAVAYYMLQGKTPLYQKDTQMMYPAATPVSESDDTSTIQSEIESTSEGSIESDLNELDSSASSL